MATDKNGKETVMTTVRRNIKNAVVIAEEDRRRKLLHQRLELARAGVTAVQKHNLSDAVRSFQSYLKVLEDIKNVGEGGLTPRLFDQKKDLPELLMISGIYWDLVKLYDHTRTADKHKEFLHYIEKYIVFARGMPYQPLCAETLRKYISNQKPVHMAEFKNAYAMLGGTKCFVATAVMDLGLPETLPRLRRFRDFYLKKKTWGRHLIAIYYKHGPSWARRVQSLPKPLRYVIAKTLDRVAAALSG